MAGAVAFIGLGNMGVPMAQHLVGAGHRVQGYDVSAAARDAAAAAGVPVEQSLASAGAKAGVAILMLPSSDVVESVLLEQGLADALEPGALVIDMSSSDPMRTRELSRTLHAKGLRLVDAPVSGGVKGAVAATLTIMVGGNAADVGEALPILDSMGTVKPTGDIGSGHALKALNNLMSATHLLVSSEAIEAGRRFGLNDDVMLEIINSSTGRSWSTEFKWPTFIITETYNSGFGLRLLVKDMRIATDVARQLGLPSRLGEAALALFEQAADELPATADHTEIAKFAASSSVEPTNG